MERVNQDEIVFENTLQYPYDYPHDIIVPVFTDPYDRKLPMLLASLACFGHTIENGNAVLPDSNLLAIIPTLTRLCNGALFTTDMQVLMEHFPPPIIKSRCIIDATLPRLQLKEFLRSQGDFRLFDQLILLDTIRPSAWVIYLLFPSLQDNIDHYIEGFFIGNVEPRAIQLSVTRVKDIFKLLLPGLSLQYRHRLKVPDNLSDDKVWTAYVLVTYLHQRGKYFELNPTTMMLHKLPILEDMRHCHDQWLGRYQRSTTSEHTHPFICTPIKDDQRRFKRLVKLGWVVIDVEGDGNCGYYSAILGLENIGIFDFSIQNKRARTISMSRNTAWQYNILRLRSRLKEQSEALLSTDYPRGDRDDKEWFLLTTAYGDDYIDRLSDFLCAPTLDKGITLLGDYNKKCTENT